jgi:integrative and conjugative element protein (TIGR02256 family)
MIVYGAEGSAEQVVLSKDVVFHVLRHRQKRPWSKEAGGQLFARFSEQATIVHVATGPRPSDRRSRRSYNPDPDAEQSEIDEMYDVGLHYVGTWHSHPEKVPTPSHMDTWTMQRTVSKAVHSLPGFLLLVVGTDDPPAGFHFSRVSRERTLLLQPSLTQRATTSPFLGEKGLFDVEATG